MEFGWAMVMAAWVFAIAGNALQGANDALAGVFTLLGIWFGGAGVGWFAYDLRRKGGE